jgi:hypothetical protein
LKRLSPAESQIALYSIAESCRLRDASLNSLWKIDRQPDSVGASWSVLSKINGFLPARE